MPAPYRPLMPHDWIRLEQLINEIFGILNEDTTLSDVVSNITTDASNLKIVSDALSTEVSDRASDIKYTSDSVVTVSNALSTEVSDRASDIKYLSDALLLAGSASDLKVVSDALSTEVSDRQSDELFLSDTIVTVSNALSDLAAEPDCPVYKYIVALAQAEGDLHLSDGTNWNISKALIKYIGVDTASTDWDLWLLQNDNGYAADDATIPAVKIINNCNGEANISLDHPYQDEDASAEVHLYFLDNSGANTADIYIKAYELA